MSVKSNIDGIRACARDAGVEMSMAKGRDLVALLLYGKSYSAAIAAERDGKLAPPQLIASRTEELRATEGERVDILVGIAAISSFAIEPITTATQAITSRRIPVPPLITLELLRTQDALAAQRGEEIEWITLNTGNYQQGKWLSFIRTGGALYVLEDAFFEGELAYLTVQFNNTVFRYRDKDDREGSNKFLSHVYSNGHWSLEPVEHLLADESDFDRTYEQIANA